MNEPTRIKDLAEKTNDKYLLDPHIIVIEPGYNPRVISSAASRQHIANLKASIKVQGVQNPLLVRWNGETRTATLVDGECRLTAVLELIAEGVEIDTVPAIQVPGNNEAERLLISLTANTGKPLEKLESGAGFARLQRLGWTQEKIAERMGVSLRFVSEAIELMDAPEDVRKLVSEKSVSPSLAIEHVRKQGAAAVSILQEKAKTAKESGKKTATKTRITKAATLIEIIRDILADVDEDKLADADRDTIAVDRKRLRRLARAIEAGKKSV